MSVLLAANAWAKRFPTPVVEPVVHEGVRYVAPNDNGRREYVEAWDIATTNKIWEVTVLKNRITFWLEEDVSWVFITHLKIEDGKLVVIDERKRQFVIDVKTRKVKKRRAKPLEATSQ